MRTMSPQEREYVMGQGWSLGSGLLGGWSAVQWGAFLDEAPAPVAAGVLSELRRIQNAASRGESPGGHLPQLAPAA